MKKLTKIILLISVITVYSIGFIFFVENYFPTTDLYIKILIYLLFLAFLVSPFYATKKKKKRPIQNALNNIGKNKKEQLMDLKKIKDVNLDVKYEAPLVSKCKCGFLLTSNMRKCPNCNRTNMNYIPKSDRKNKILDI